MRVLLVIVSASVLAVAGCSGESPPAAQPAASPECTFDTTVDGVTVTKQAGASPTVTVEPDAKPPKELVVEELCPGSGPRAAIGDLVVTDYAMAPYSTGQQLESSFERGQPLTLPLIRGTGTIEGFITGIEGMQPGGVRLVLVPGSKAYGKTPPPGSPFAPNESFAFVLQLNQAQALASPSP